MATNTLTLEPVYQYDPDLYLREIIIVGAGGTGSQVIRSVARMVYDMNQRNMQTPSIRLIDPDIIEDKNVGRQMFTPPDIGQYKAAVLGRRFNLQLGLDIIWHTEEFNHERHITIPGSTVIIGCVDNHLARVAISEAKQIWIDCGNHFDSGQVIIGSTSSPNDVKPYHPTEHSKKTIPYVRNLPNAGVIFPDLLQPEAQPAPQISCADLTEQGDQHLLINDNVAQVAASYVYSILHRQPITTFATFINLNPYQVRSEPITESALTRYVDNLTLE